MEMGFVFKHYHTKKANWIPLIGETEQMSQFEYDLK